MLYHSQEHLKTQNSKMTKQSLSQKLQQKIGLKQIQFLNILQLPISEINERINEELENNPVLEQEEPKEDDGLGVVDQNKNYLKKNTDHLQYANYNQNENNLSLSEYLKQQLIGLDINERERFLSKYIIDNSSDKVKSILSKLSVVNSRYLNASSTNNPLSLLKPLLSKLFEV